MNRTDALWESYIDRIGGREMYMRDGTYHYHLDVLRGLLRHLEVVLADEEIPPEQAERILRCLIYGGPSVVDAEERIRTHRRMVDLATESVSPSIFVDVHSGDYPGQRPAGPCPVVGACGKPCSSEDVCRGVAERRQQVDG